MVVNGMNFPKADKRGKHGNHSRGEKHPRWNNDKIVSQHGYIKIRVGTNHPLSDPNGYAYEHLLVWISAGNNPPASDELLHHRNGNKKDNRYINLKLVKRTEHNSLHLSERGRDSLGRFLPRQNLG